MINIRYRIVWAKAYIKQVYYRIFYKIVIDETGSILPKLGKGKYISVLKKGAYVDIVNENKGSNEYIRMIPYQPNHGYMVERWENGKLCGRNIMDFYFIKNHLLSINGEKESN